jgi:tight adherence protein B
VDLTAAAAAMRGAWIAGFALVVGLAVVVFVLASDGTIPLRLTLDRYTAHLDRRMKALFIRTPAKAVVQMQAAAALVLIALALAGGGWPVALFALVIPFVPGAVLDRLRQQRVEAIEDQIDGFLLALANALKTTASIGDGLRSVHAVIRDPLRQDLGLVLKEMRVGSALDQALLVLAQRVGSRQLDMALSTILIGRQVGGNLPRILESSASSFREMARLEGVVRTKTAEGRFQLIVLALFPFVIATGLELISPGYFEPLREGVIGPVLLLVAGICWAASIVVARKILAVDL